MLKKKRLKELRAKNDRPFNRRILGFSAPKPAQARVESSVPKQKRNRRKKKKKNLEKQIEQNLRQVLLF